MRCRELIFCMPISGYPSNGKTLGKIKSLKVGYFLTGLMEHSILSRSGPG